MHLLYLGIILEWMNECSLECLFQQEELLLEKGYQKITVLKERETRYKWDNY